MRISLFSLSAFSVFLGAFLLFVIQPVAGKELLPSFGGSASVWSVSLLFFTTMLFVGYLYVYGLTRLSFKKQFTIHVAAIAISLAIAVVCMWVRGFHAIEFADTPALSVFLTLLFSLGAPYVLLSSTSPLMQYWYGVVTGKEPYVLYALSNAASLGALLLYPFLVEPFVSLRNQESVWVVLFFLYALLGVFGLLRFLKVSLIQKEVEASVISFSEGVVTILLAALPSFLLVATTTHITQVLVPIPLLWVVPLALYLVSFILAFAGRGQSLYTPLLFFLAAVAAWFLTPASYERIVPQIFSYLTLLFFCALSCHVLLYKGRPKSPSLPLFFVFLSFGGAVGALFASIVAPLLFNNVYEFALGLAISASLAMWLLPNVFFPRILDARQILAGKLLFVFVTLVLFVRYCVPPEIVPVISTRNFYGTANVFFQSEMTSLMHGGTLHGAQFVRAEDARLPTTYFTPGSGVGRAILYAQRIRKPDEIRVGTIGLGVGTIAAYCRPGDTYVFYEIDSRIENIARTYFSYLAHCEASEVRIGDGRIVLEKERKNQVRGDYDVLAVDAFSDDTIPMHLLTLEAIDLYRSHLRTPQSIIAIHISNRYLDLSPIVFRAAAELSMNAILVADDGESSPGGSPSAWVLLSEDSDVFRSVIFANANGIPPHAAAHAWTDDYSSLLPVLNLPKPW